MARARVIVTYFIIAHYFLSFCKNNVILQNEDHFETLQFQIATNVHRYGRKCLNFSQYFCLIKFLTTEKRHRLSQINDQMEFWDLAIESYSRSNWYPLYQVAGEYCCVFQTNMYNREGRRNGFTPSEEAVFLFKKINFNLTLNEHNYKNNNQNL